MVQVRVLAVDKERVRSPDAREELRRNTRRIFQHISGYFGILQYTSVYFRILQETSGYFRILRDTSGYFRICEREEQRRNTRIVFQDLLFDL